MKEIVILSGKGGTGKTSITASFATLAGNSVVVADCDVDAADMHLLVQPDFAKAEDFYSGLVAEINQDSCNNCGVCEEVCRFDAISETKGQYFINSLNCEGCSYCSRVCPQNAIQMNDNLAGKWFISETRTGSPMVHARLGIGAENSGKLVSKVKNEAKKLAEARIKEFVIVDGSPGVGCPVVSSLSGAHFVLLVTEPTVSGIHDLKRVYELVKKFNIQAGCIINKSDLNPWISDEIVTFMEQENIIHISSLPFDDSFTEAMVNAQTIVEYDHDNLNKIITYSWKKIKQIVAEG